MSETPSLPTSKPGKKSRFEKPSKEASPILNNGETSDPENKPSSTRRNKGGHPKTRHLEPAITTEPRDRTSEALRRLGITDLSKIRRLPPINQLLKEQSRSGIAGAIESLRMSDGELSQKFLETWDDIPERDRECVTIEIVAIAAGVDPRALLGEILLAAREYSVVKFKLRALEAHPEILEKRIEFAKLTGGYRDRDAIDTILGALPRAKTTFIDKFYAGSETPVPDSSEDGEAEDKPKAVSQAEEMVEDENFIFPDSELMQDKIQPIRQKMLESKR